MIDPIILKGFRDSMPKEEMPKRKITETLEKGFQAYGFVPIDTPVLEYSSVLLGKGGGETDKQVFHFEDNGGREVAMRFDLTVPFARFMAAHYSELALPFKRYHINKVWRGEKPQKGRYREFIQCDFDIVGVDNVQADFEILSMMHHSFSLMGVDGYTFHISHRGLFNTFLEKEGIADKSIDILRAVDKLMKIGKDSVREILIETIGDENKADKVLEYITAGGSSFLETLSVLETLSGGSSEGSERLRAIYALLSEVGIADSFVLDPSITRGLDYDTGIVYETFLDALPSLGSVCSGGRYDNLTGIFGMPGLSGVGISFGADRIYDVLGQLDLYPAEAEAGTQLLFINFGAAEAAHCLQLARAARAAGIATEVYPDAAKMKKQMAYANARSIPFVALVGESEMQAGVLTLKNMATGEQQQLSIADAVALIQQACAVVVRAPSP